MVVNKKGLSPTLIAKVMDYNPAKIFGLYGRKGAFEIGFDGDIVIVDNDAAYDLDENGDPVAVDIDGRQLDECIIKRVIATGGQTIDIRDGKVYVDEKELDEPYIAKGARTYPLNGFNNKYPITIPEGYYFVMGDNRERSSDSRHADVGLIKKSQIYGKALVRYSPLSKFKFLWDTEDESAE